MHSLLVPLLHFDRIRITIQSPSEGSHFLSMNIEPKFENDGAFSSFFTTNRSHKSRNRNPSKGYADSTMLSFEKSKISCERSLRSTNLFKIQTNAKPIESTTIACQEKENRAKSSMRVYLRLRADHFAKTLGNQVQGLKDKSMSRNRLILQSQNNIRKIKALKIKQSHFETTAFAAHKMGRRIKTEQNDRNGSYREISAQYETKRIPGQDQARLSNSNQESAHLFKRTVRIIEQYNQGSTSTVYRAVMLNRSAASTYEQIVVKKVEVNDEHINRQAEFASRLRNPYLVQFKGIYCTQNEQKTKKYLNIMMEKYDFNLREVLATQKVNNLAIKLYLYQMLRSLVFLHAKSICHRDIKPENFLVKGWRIVLSDFGMSKRLRNHSSNKKSVLFEQQNQEEEEESMTYVFAREYRAPELLLDYKYYDTSVDIWALGCIAVQMMTHRVLFQGSDNLDQLTKIFRILGTPKWSTIGFMNKRVPKLPKVEGMGLSTAIGQRILREEKHFLSLVQKMLEFDPNNRICAIDALTLPFFDQIRQQSTYGSISKLLHQLSLFSFPKEQIFGKEELLAKLVPYWTRESCKKFGTHIPNINKF